MSPLLRVTSLTGLCLLSAILAQAVASALDPCVMSKPSTCSDTSWLSWSPGFATAVKGFIGHTRVSYFRPKKTLSWQALYGLGGPPEERLRLPENRYLFSACPAHDCGGQAAAIILDDQGNIQAIGFSSFHCCEPHTDLNHRYLDFYVRRGASADILIAELKNWGTGSTITSMLHDPHDDDGIASRISTHLLQ
jgi:hypothetical protein